VRRRCCKRPITAPPFTCGIWPVRYEPVGNARSKSATATHSGLSARLDHLAAVALVGHLVAEALRLSDMTRADHVRGDSVRTELGGKAGAQGGKPTHGLRLTKALLTGKAISNTKLGWHGPWADAFQVLTVGLL